MEEKEYQIWWQLHCRSAKGETLSGDERQIYEAGRAALEAEETTSLRPSTAEWQTWQERWRELNLRNQQLAQQELDLRQVAVQLEHQYLTLTGERLGLEV